MPEFKIQRPESIKRSILMRVVSSPWDGLNFIANKLVGARVSSQIFPASHINYHDKDKGGLPQDWQAQMGQTLEAYRSEITYAFHTLVTYDGAALDTLEIIHNEQKIKPIGEQVFVIYFNGNGTHIACCLEDDLLPNVIQYKYNQVCFNFRGTNRHGQAPLTANDLVTDGIAQVQRLLNQNVLAKNIFLRGHSLGGAIAAIVGQHFHAHHQPVRVFNERSFSNMTDLACWHLRGMIQPEKSLLRRIGGRLAVSLLLRLTGWEINAAEAFKSIPPEYRAYAVVRTLKENRTSAHIDDDVIPHYASMHEALSDERKKDKARLAMLRQNPDQYAAEIAGLERELKAVKMQTQAGKPGHSTSSRDEHVKNIKGETVAVLFAHFVEKAAVKPEEESKEKNTQMRPGH